jgi:hypothetical protein
LYATDIDGHEILKVDGDVTLDTTGAIDANAVFRYYGVDVDDT